MFLFTSFFFFVFLMCEEGCKFALKRLIFLSVIKSKSFVPFAISAIYPALYARRYFPFL